MALISINICLFVNLKMFVIKYYWLLLLIVTIIIMIISIQKILLKKIFTLRYL